jgi:biopolymer transport protein ExbB
MKFLVNRFDHFIHAGSSGLVGRRVATALISASVWLGLFGSRLALAQNSSGGASARRGLFQIVFAGGWVGISIIVLLLLLSVTAAYLVFEHLLTIRRQELVPEPLQDELRDLLAKRRVTEAEAACQAEPSLLSFVVQQGLAERDGGWPAIEKALEDALADQAAQLLRKIEYLSLIGNIAPMVGLLGTVTGMIFAFQEVASSQGAAGAGDLAEGIYQALVTTVGGLLVAIPSLAAYAILRNRVDQLVAEASYVILHVCRPLKRGSVTEPAPPPPAPSP